MKKTVEERVSSVCTDLLLEQCRGKDGYVNKSMLTEAMVDQTIFDVSTSTLFRGREIDASIVKADLMRRHIHSEASHD